MEASWKYILIADGVRSRIREGKLQERDLVSIKYLTQEHDVARQDGRQGGGPARAGRAVRQRFPGIGYIRDAGRDARACP